MITVTDNSDKQINAALLSIDADIKQLKTDTDSTVSSLKSSIGTTKAGLTSGATYDINISGNAATATTAVYASTAGSTSTASTAGTASKVTNSLTITNNGTTYTYDGSSAVSVPIATSIASALTTNITNTYSNSAVGTTTYNGSADVANNIYLPNQSLNSTDSPTFNTVTATLSGNATSADKVNNAITITSTTGYTTPSTIVYDGSEAKTATIYTPDQEVNKTSSPTFNTVTAALNGNATSADKVNNVLTLNVGGTTTSYDGSTAKTVTIGSNAKLTVATTDTYTAASTTEYDGSTAKTATIYTPDQEVNKTSSPTFAKISYSGNTGIVDLSSQISWVSSLVDSVFLRAIKVNGVVYLYGGMTYKGSVSIPTQIIGTGLPSAYRPMTDVFSCCEWYSSSANSTGAWRSLVKTTGEVGIYEVGTSNGSFLALSISYPVAS